jgi:hypothetical protein
MEDGVGEAHKREGRLIFRGTSLLVLIFPTATGDSFAIPLSVGNRHRNRFKS